MALASDGEWSAVGIPAGVAGSDTEAIDCAVETLDQDDYSIAWVEATVPLPDEVVVEGKVTS